MKQFKKSNALLSLVYIAMTKHLNILTPTEVRSKQITKIKKKKNLVSIAGN